MPDTGGNLPPDIAAQVARALAEDVGEGDVTASLIPPGQSAVATLITREDMVLCGTAWFDEVLRQVDPAVRVDWRAQDGSSITAGSELCSISGPARALLTAERCAMNFLQTLSGTATITRRFAEALAGTPCRVLDTRKTIPGLRLAQKYAVRCGGGTNHRLGLYDRVLIKENHIAAAGSIAAAIRNARTTQSVPVEVEVETLQEFRQALPEAPDYIMLDEFSLEDMRTAVAERNRSGSSVKIEASGGVSLEGLRRIADTGVDFISVGALTKHLHAIDLSMRLSRTS